MNAAQIRSGFIARIPLMGALPEVELLGKSIYAILEEDDTVIDFLVWKTVIDASFKGSVPCFVSTSSISASLLRSGLSNDAHREMTDHRLYTLEFELDSKLLASDRLHCNLLDYIQAMRQDKPGLLVIKGAEKLFSNMDESTLLTWRNWAERQGSAVAFVFARNSDKNNDVFTQIHHLSYLFAGIACMTQRNGGPLWQIHHWFGPAGLSVANSYALKRTSHNQLEVIPEAALGTLKVLALTPAGEETAFFAQSTVFRPNEIPIKNWQVIEGTADNLLTNLEGAVDATVVLSFTHNTDFDVLMRCVFDLRKRCDSRLKIVVREVNLSLRHSQEAFLIHLGANLIVPLQIGYARFLSLTMLIYGQKFEHNLARTFEQTVAMSAYSDHLGYLPPEQFIAAAKEVLTRSRATQEQCALLRLFPAEDHNLLEVLTDCTIKRTGDFVTADDTCVYLLLSGCLPINVEKTLDRIFPLPANQIFSRAENFPAAACMQMAIYDLEAQHRMKPFANLTDQIAARLQTSNSPHVTPVIVDDKGPVTHRFDAPAPATRRQLFVNGAQAGSEFTIIRPWDSV